MEINRIALLAAVQRARPALSSQVYVRSLTYFMLKGGHVTAYDEVMAITAAVPGGFGDLGTCVPGATLIDALSQYTSPTIKVTREDGNLVLVSGRSKLKLPTLPVTDFLYAPAREEVVSINIDQSIVDALTACLAVAGRDETLPSQLGVTLTEVDGHLMAFATDNVTMSRFDIGAAPESVLSTPTPMSVLLPTKFCDQVVSLRKAFPALTATLDVGTQTVTARFGAEVTVKARLPVDVPLLPYADRFDATVDPAALGGAAVPIPDGFDGAVQRAALVLGKTDTGGVTIDAQDGLLIFSASGTQGEVTDQLEGSWDALVGGPFTVDPALVLRGCKQCTEFLPLPGVLAMIGAGGRFTHLIAHGA